MAWLFAFVLVFALYATPSSVALAQDLPVSDGVTLSLSTDNPVPGQIVTVTANSYSADISGARLTWTVNDKVVKDEVGAMSIDVSAPALGSKLNISVSASNPEGMTYIGTVIIGSGAVDMIVESDGYIPPIFLGKSPTAYQNSVKVIAVPHLADSSGKEYNPSNLIYQWKKNGQVIADKSGYGKRSITIEGELIPREFDLSVNVSTRTTADQAIGTTLIQPSAPSANIYINDPLYGTLFNRAVGEKLGIGTKKETSLLVVPFGFNKSRSITWLLNDTERTELADKLNITLRSPGDDGGSSDISVRISSPANILQGATAAFTAYFGATKTTETNNTEFSI